MNSNRHPSRSKWLSRMDLRYYLCLLTELVECSSALRHPPSAPAKCHWSMCAGIHIEEGEVEGGWSGDQTQNAISSHPIKELSRACQLTRCAAGTEYCQCSDLLALCFIYLSNVAENLHKSSLWYSIWKITTVTQCFGAFNFYTH